MQRGSSMTLIDVKRPSLSFVCTCDTKGKWTCTYDTPQSTSVGKDATLPLT